MALPKAVADGYRGFKAVAVATDVYPPASPCGMCRQFMNEFCGKEMPVIMLGKDSWEGEWLVRTMGEVSLCFLFSLALVMCGLRVEEDCL